MHIMFIGDPSYVSVCGGHRVEKFVFVEAQFGEFITGIVGCRLGGFLSSSRTVLHLHSVSMILIIISSQ